MSKSGRLSALLLAGENEIDADQYQGKIRIAQVRGALGQEASIDGHDLGDVRHRVFRQTGALRGEKDVAGSCCPAQVARQRHDHGRGESARVERISLHDHDGTPEACTGAGWVGERCPAHITLANYHSLRSSARRPASASHSSGSAPSSTTTSSSAPVTERGSRRHTYSASASR